MKLFCRHLYKKTGKYWDYRNILWGWTTNYEYKCVKCGKRMWLDYKGYDRRTDKYYNIIN